MARRIGHNEVAARCGKVAIGDINGDALLAFSFKPIQQQREVRRVTGGTMALAIGGKRDVSILKNQPAIMQ